MRVGREVGGREAQRPPALVAVDDVPFQLEGPAQERGGAGEVALAHELADAARRDALDERHRSDVQPQAAQKLDVAAPPGAEAEVLAGDDDLRPDRGEVVRDELLGLAARRAPA